jgi:acyl-CoA thioesterase FadM
MVRLGRTSGVTEQLIARVTGDQLQIASRALITVVVYDYASNQPTPIPVAWRERVKAYEIVPPEE